MGRHRQLGVLSFVAVLAAAAPAGALELGFPVACQIGDDCAIQHYVDRDPGPGASDYRCGHQTYDGHNGTDIRVQTLREMSAGVDVLAAAAGTVSRVRDEMPDVIYDENAPEGVADRECGNGVVIDHGDGWETQYCHMKLGSIRVAPGDTVDQGAVLGEVGLSGMTEFPHLHFGVRKGEANLDPFATNGPDGGATCAFAGDGDTGLWAPDIAALLAYRPAFVLNAGFAEGVVEMEQVETGELEDEAPGPESPALVFFGRAIGLEAGDVQKVLVTGPDGGVFAENEIDPLDRPMAQYFAFAGRKRHEAPWPAGTYSGRYSVIRDGKEIAFRDAELEIPDAR
ncbi:MAG: M23 family metallopeptidase [Bauldia sp.]|nr:M23 family metallopeptidase [Bauldia sp.]